MIIKNKSSFPVKNEFGFSLIELTITMTILLILLASASAVLLGVNREFKAQKPRLDALNNVQAAMDTITRITRMAGTKPTGCADAFTVSRVTPSNKNADGSFSRMRIQADWNPSDCALTGIDEDVTVFSSNGKLYLDAAQTKVFVDKVGAVKFRFHDAGGSLIADPVANSNLIKIVKIEADTLVPGETSTKISTTVRIREG